MFNLTVKYIGKGKSDFIPIIFKEKLGTYGNFGEDAIFIKHLKDISFFGVFDGVSGVSNNGIDPAEFPFEFSKEMILKLNENSNIPEEIFAIKNILTEKSFIGSSTLNISSFNKNTGVFKNFNLGDSYSVILRKDKNNKYEKIIDSIIQQHSFNHPYQLSNLQHSVIHFPNSIQKFEIQLEKNDLIISSTDGLWDNLFLEEIIDILNKSDNLDKFVNDAMNKINYLFDNIDNFERIGPFALNCIKNNNPYRKHSKIDDVSILIAKVD
jgi:serine/threonine protein phosphatase PrpC